MAKKSRVNPIYSRSFIYASISVLVYLVEGQKGGKMVDWSIKEMSRLMHKKPLPVSRDREWKTLYIY
jgi:hypothetical protein